MSANIIWTIDCTIRDGQRDALEALMHDMVESASQEPGTLNYEWSLAEDGKSLHVYERYRDVAATRAHLGSWASFADRFSAAVDIKRFVVFSDLPQELRDAVAGLSPIYMTRIGGFVR